MTRDEMLQRLEQMLDAALAAEAVPAGLAEDTSDLDADRACDSYALWSAMTALVQEVRLQGRAFQELNHTLEAQTEKALAELRAVWTDRERHLQRDAERRSRREILGSLVDLRDRLGRGLLTARGRLEAMQSAKPAGWLARWLQKPRADEDEALAAVMRGYELGIERLDQTLEEFHAREIRCAGEIFDPRRMNAIESEATDAYPEGTVLEVYRSGYEWNGEVFRPAQVKVARARRNENE